MALTKVSYSMITGAVANALDFGADPTGATDSTTAVLAAIQSLRANPSQILSTIGGTLITAYSSGTVFFPNGTYKLSPGVLYITQDLGLIFKGAGSRRTNNAVKAPTTLLFTGAATSYCISVYGNGARGFTLEDLDVCYADPTFTGSVLDIFDCPGVTANRVYFGTVGTSALTRLRTAASCVRATYDEFLSFTNCVFNGAVDGVWFDDVRSEFGNPFGGSVSSFVSCVWYDVSNVMIRHDGRRTRVSLSLVSCGFNPIAVDCVRCVDLNNVEGLTMLSCAFGPSVGNKASAEWIRLVNCTGAMTSCTFDDLTKAGTFEGNLNLSNNRVFSTDGFTLRSGVIVARGNEFSQCATGWSFEPTNLLNFTVGPDQFKTGVTRSYDVPADSALLSGRVIYAAPLDASVNKFRNLSGRVNISADVAYQTISDAFYTIPITSTGYDIVATGATNQAFTLPTPVPGTEFSVVKLSGVNLSVSCPAGVNFTGVGTGTSTSAALNGTNKGTLTLKAAGTVAWTVFSQTNTWAYT